VKCECGCASRTIGAFVLEKLDAVEPMAREALRDAERQGDVRSEHFAHHFLADYPLIRGRFGSGGAAVSARVRACARTW